MRWILRNKINTGIAFFRVIDRGPFDMTLYGDEIYSFFEKSRNPHDDGIHGALLFTRIFRLGNIKSPDEFIEVRYDKQKATLADVQGWLTSFGINVTFSGEE